MDRARPLVRVMLSPVQVMLRPRREERGQEGKRARGKRAIHECSWVLSLGRAVVSANQIHHSYSEDLISTFYHVTFHHHHSFSI